MNPLCQNVLPIVPMFLLAFVIVLCNGFIAHPAQITQELRPLFNSSPIGSGGPLSKWIPLTLFSNGTICNVSKSSHQCPAGLLQPLPVPRLPWSHIAIDLVTDLPSSRNYSTILTVIDRFSKACHLIPLNKLPTAFETAEVLLEQVFRFY